MQRVLLSDLPLFAKDVLKKLTIKNTATIITLSGELGAGKTTFVQSLGKVLGITENIQSPTYVLMKKYQIKKVTPFNTLVHIDAYRLAKPEEFSALKPKHFLQDPKALVIIEWPEKVAKALPPADIIINFSSENASESERYVLIKK